MSRASVVSSNLRFETWINFSLLALVIRMTTIAVEITMQDAEQSINVHSSMVDGDD